jgi:hypothetical protein
MSWIPGAKRQSRTGSLRQLLREPSGSNCSRAKSPFAHACVSQIHGRHTRVAPCRIAVFGCIEAPPSSSRLTVAFASQLLLLTCCAISASPPPRGSRELAVHGSSEFIASGRHLHTSSFCTSLLCVVILLPPVVGPALASALLRRRSLRDRPCQGTAVRDLVALRAGPSRAATPHLHTRIPEPRASLAHIALLLTRLKPPCAPLLAPGHSPPLESCSCAHTLTPPASAPCLLQPCRVIPAHPCSSSHSAPPRTCYSTRAPASPAFAPARATPEPTRCFHCAALQLPCSPDASSPASRRTAHA